MATRIVKSMQRSSTLLQTHARIISMRAQNDPLFFTPMTLSSDLHVYQSQAASSINQIDIEIGMGLISLTMAPVFIAFQLRHAKRHPRVLKHASLLMLFVLTLGYLIQLVSSFDAIFPNRSRRTIWGVEVWLQQAEVLLVRVMTTVVCLLLLRLIHLSWVSKGTAPEGHWYTERKVLYVCFPTYVLGGIIALRTASVRANTGRLVKSYAGGGTIVATMNSNSLSDSLLLRAMKAYAGLTIDFFLFPQVVGNCVWEVEDKILSPAFYFGVTLVRSMPHLYDILRESRLVPRIGGVYYFADPTWDVYSSAWDVFISCGTLLLAVLVLIQQRYGAGSVITPLSWRKRTSYTKISITSL